MTETSTTTNQKYKDRLFNFIFGSDENREWTLSLYNAVNGSDYDDPSLIEYNTLKDVLFLGMKNDTSFLISDIMSVYEHQSTFNPNMPLRMLQYVGDLYAGYIEKNKYNKYGRKLINLPTPKLVTFYNGTSDREDETILKLTDSFSESSRDKSDIEVKVRMINVNYGKNKEIMDRCQPLREYSWLINEIKLYQKLEYAISAAAEKAIISMPNEFEIKRFLMIHKQEVQGMLDTEYNEAEAMELFKEEGRNEGRAEGRDKHIIDLVCKKLRKGKDIAAIAEDLEESEELISKICKAAERFAPDYDSELVFNAYQEN